MYFYRKYKKHYHMISLFATVIFMIYLVLTPPAYSLSRDASPSNNRSGSGLVKMASFKTSVFTDNELINDTGFYYIMDRSQQESRQLPNLIYYAFAVMLVGYGVLIHISKCFNRQNMQHISVLALSKGGHAPPIAILI